MPTAIITTDDLREFKLELLAEIKELLNVNQSKMTKKEWLRSSHVMDMLQISMTTLHSLRVKGTLPFIKIGGLIFYEAREIEKVLMDNAVKPFKTKR